MSDAIVTGTEWDEFKVLIGTVYNLMKACLDF